MLRITGPDVATDGNGAGKDGFAAEDQDLGVAATTVTEVWLNAVQEEICGVIEADGTPLDSTNGQLLQALKNMFFKFSLLSNEIRTAAASYTAAFRAVAWDAALGFAAVGTNGEIQTSPFGDVWTHHAAPGSYTGTFRSVCCNGSLFVAVGDAPVSGLAQIHTSPDGVTWTARTAANSFNQSLRAVGWNSTLNLFIAVGDSGEIQTSGNGTTWTHRAAGSSYAGQFLAVASSGGTIVIAGSGGEIQVSTNGTTWTRSNTGTDAFNSLASDGTLFYAWGQNSSATSTVLKTSPDGTTWTVVSGAATSGLGACVRYVAGLGVVAIAVDGVNTKVSFSVDGTSWIIVGSLPSIGLLCFAFDGARLLLVGLGGAIRQTLAVVT